MKKTATFDYSFPRFLGQIRLDDYGYKFAKKITTLEIRNCHTFDLLAKFELDLGEFGNMLNTGRYTLMKDHTLTA